MLNFFDIQFGGPLGRLVAKPPPGLENPRAIGSVRVHCEKTPNDEAFKHAVGAQAINTLKAILSAPGYDIASAVANSSELQKQFAARLGADLKAQGVQQLEVTVLALK
jgi:hypothetical protein